MRPPSTPIFRGISHRIAAQFTAFVFLLFLVNGVLFLGADFVNARQQARMRLERESLAVLRQIENLPVPAIRTLPLHIRERIRIVDAFGTPIIEGAVLQNVPFVPIEGYRDVVIQDERWRVLTVPIVNSGLIVGYAQIGDLERLSLRDIPHRALLYFLVSLGVSALTYAVGLSFARRSLRPAEETMRRLEQFTQDASHELRTPIAVVNSSLDLALRTGEHKEGIAAAKEELKQVSGLVERLLDLARLGDLTLQRTSVDLTALVAQAVERHRLLSAERGITIDAHLAADVMVHGDETLLRQIIGNLLSNAIKFNRKNGRIHVRLTQKMLEVEDTGIGIPKSARGKIFDRFFQADASRANQGFGLGLSLVRRIVELHGWTVDVRSQEGIGTTFTVRFGK